VLDPKLLPLDEVVQLYARSFDIELVFSLLEDEDHLIALSASIGRVLAFALRP
jgi:rRNA processing protein Krr1/Pno1